MRPEHRRFVAAVLTLVGTVIGVGIFGIPYALSRVGLVPAILYFGVLGLVQLLQHLFFAEAAIASDEPLRLVGLVEKYLGKGSRHLASVALICSYWGGLLAYMLVGGTFLHLLATSAGFGGEAAAYQWGWSLLAAALVFGGLSVITRIGTVATVGLVLAMFWIFLLGAPHVAAANFLPLWRGGDLLLPYGVILFSLSGLPAILEMEDILRGQHRLYRRAAVAGTLIATGLTAVFSFVVWGITGPATTEASAVGLQSVVGGHMGTVVAAFGFLAVATSFFSTALNLQSTFQFDYRLAKPVAWLLTFALPFAALALGTDDFVGIVSFTGAVFGGVTAIMVALLYVAVTKKHAVREKPLGVPVGFAYASIVVLGMGAVLSVAESLRGLV